MSHFDARVLSFDASTASSKRERSSTSRLVGTGGLEPPTSCMSSRRSNQLSYVPMSCRAGARTTVYRRRASPVETPGRGDGCPEFSTGEARLCLCLAAARPPCRAARRSSAALRRRPTAGMATPTVGPQAALVDRAGAVDREVALGGQPEAVVLRAGGRASGRRRCRPSARRRARRGCCPTSAAAKTSAALAVPFETSSTTGIVTAPSPGSALVVTRLGAAAGANREHAALDEQPRRRDAVFGRAVGDAAQIDHRARRASAPPAPSKIFFERRRGARTEAGDAHVGDAAGQRLDRGRLGRAASRASAR